MSQTHGTTRLTSLRPCQQIDTCMYTHTHPYIYTVYTHNASQKQTNKRPCKLENMRHHETQNEHERTIITSICDPFVSELCGRTPRIGLTFPGKPIGQANILMHLGSNKLKQMGFVSCGKPNNNPSQKRFLIWYSPSWGDFEFTPQVVG